MRVASFAATVVAAAAVLAGCGEDNPSAEADRSVAEQPAESQPTTSEVQSSSAQPERKQFAGLHRCARAWNKGAGEAQLKDLGLAALVDPVRRNRKATAFVDEWTFADAGVALIGHGKRGETATVRRGQCLVATGPDIGRVFVLFGKTWQQVSGDAPTEAAYPAVMMAQAGGDAWIRRDGTVLPILPEQSGN